MPDEDNLRPESQQAQAMPDRELLVAYLDGELDADQARQVEQLIASDAGVENEVRQLERAWNLLDRLPRAEVSPSFTESTVEMVALAVEDELRVADGKRRNAAWSVALLAACILGFLGARLWPDPNRQLLRDLPLIDNVEAYRQTPDIDFVRQLAKSGAFEGQTTSAASAAAFADRKKWLDSLQAEQKEDVHRKYERLGHLPADEQLRLRALQATIAADGDAGQLTATLALFQQWLEQLPGVERAELMALGTEQRLQRIKRMRREEARRLAAEDAQPFISWFAGVFPRVLPPARRAKVEEELAGASEDKRAAVLRRELAGLPFAKRLQPQGAQKGVGRTGAGPLIKPQALAELEKGLSPHGQQVLKKCKNNDERRMLILSWAAQALGPPAARGNPLSLPDVDEDDLKRFFEQLNPVQRTKLLNLPAEQMKRQLLARYQAKRAAEKRQKTPDKETKPGE
jgi:hypothetical protein